MKWSDELIDRFLYYYDSFEALVVRQLFIGKIRNGFLFSPLSFFPTCQRVAILKNRDR